MHLCLHYKNIVTDAVEIFEVSVYQGETNFIVEGENITLSCVAIGYPPPLIQWRKLNGSLSDRVSSTDMSMSTNEGNVTRVTVDLIFTTINREDTGDYECITRNLLNFVKENISLNVQCMKFVVILHLCVL